jgi:glutamate synthase (NADPH/NADH) large chain
MLAHNGEINTIRGNKNWMKSHEIKMASLAFGDQSEDIKPLSLRAHRTLPRWMPCSRRWCRSGRDAPTAKLMLVPEAWQSNGDDLPRRTRTCTTISPR